MEVKIITSSDVVLEYVEELKTHMIQLHAVNKKFTSNNNPSDIDAASEFVKLNKY